MKSISFRADEKLIERARMVAQARCTTLNKAFREWLVEYVAQSANVRAAEALLHRLGHVRADRHFTREEMNYR